MKNNMNFISMILTITTATTIFAGTYTADAASVNVYDANELEVFSSRTMDDIADLYSDACYSNSMYNNKDSSTWYAEVPSTLYPYNPGMISDAAHSTMISMTNFYRWLVGCSTIEEARYGEVNLPLQAGALVRNFSWNHVVSDSDKPADMDDELWQQGADCNHNILAKDYSPLDSITAWINEGYNSDTQTWKTVGHRSILLDYDLDTMSYGFCSRIAIGTAGTSNKEIDVPFTAYPVPGYMPTNLLNPSATAWSININEDKFEFDDIEDITVNITNTTTGQHWERTYDDDTVIYSFGLIAFAQPDDFVDMKYTDSYQVEITGINEIANNTPATFTYRVDFFDMADSVLTQVVNADTCRRYMIAPEMMNEADLERIASILPTEIDVVADNKQIFTVPIDGEWKLDMDNNRFVAKGDLTKVSGRLSDPNGYLNEIVIPYEVKTDVCAIYDTLDIVPQVVKPGENVTISAYRTNSSTDTVNIFKMEQTNDGDFDVETVFDSSKTRTGMIDGFDIECATGDNMGEYLSVYYDGYSLSQRYTVPVYVSNAVSTLEITGTTAFDINCDGSESMKDVIALDRMILGITHTKKAADVNNDNRVNIFDLIEVKAHLCEAL